VFIKPITLSFFAMAITCSRISSSVKEAVFPFNKFLGVDPILGPEMRSTGEVMLNVLHNATNHHILAIRNNINIYLDSEILVVS
jgi:hypothetical protein